MPTRSSPALLAAALVALVAALPGPTVAQVERARNAPCTGIYTGAARGVFWCRVAVVHDARTNRSTLRVETEDDIQLNGDALALTPGALEWNGPPAIGLVKGTALLVASATLRTGQPPNEVDYAAARAAPGVSPDQGDVSLEFVRADPGTKNGDAQVYLVHGTFQARLPPRPGSKGVGEVRVTVRF